MANSMSIQIIIIIEQVQMSPNNSIVMITIIFNQAQRADWEFKCPMYNWILLLYLLAIKWVDLIPK